MKLLALDTATEACSAALNIDDEIIEHFEVIPRQHSKALLPMVENLLKEAGLAVTELDALVYGRGPGAFTGLRVATAMAQGIAFGADLPLIPVSTLAALAQQGLRCHQDSHVMAAIDARMGEVYWSAYIADNGIMQPVVDEIVCLPEEISLPQTIDNKPWLGMGTGWSYRERLTQAGACVHNCDANVFPHAQDMATLATTTFKAGDFIDPEQALPVYLRNKVALKKSER
ncbi:tRNA threonylcarbamoyladenosine biosynthesis protein TsaB [invertebrate metagenome]|uniref:tRNA threonylcarbamoyladenosine biosynthesis protein TsaB n=1 Tax=invertebrate metagenome TaxID=1711999 RepID=A0A2H9TC28_9ZZZZ